MMCYSQILPCCCLYFVFASALFSDDVFGHQVVNERRLLQAQAPKKPCFFNFKNLMNFTIIKSECNAPEYPEKPCCDGFKKFACPFVDYINDNTTMCADDMIASLETIGKFPTDLFVRMCQDGKDGILCPAPSPSPPVPDQNAVVAPPPIFMLQLFTLLLLSLHFNI